MCGIAGLWAPGTRDIEVVAGAMADAIAHRGPDSSGTWSDATAGIALSHRRLAIIDLSPHGHQPMISASGRYVITFNGEIYNYRALRCELLGTQSFQGDSDTEVLLAAIERWGIAGAVDRFIGMFAFAVWDRAEQALTLVRDRVGIKPLYYGVSGGALLFGSELNALRAAPHFSAAIDRDALTLLLRHNCIPAPHCIYQGIRKLPPGMMVTLCAPRADAAPVSYWSAAQVLSREPETNVNDVEAVEQLDALLRDAVRLRMIADVPLGAFLSGGVDSSTVVALMQRQSSAPVRTFTIGSHSSYTNEAHYAAEVARHLGTDHTELYLSDDDARALIPLLPAIYDEPFADSSQLAAVAVSRLARRHVTVALSGDGGDELFAGYNRHVWGARVGAAIERAPHWLRKRTAGGLRALSPRTWDRVYAHAQPALPRALRVTMPGYKMHKLAEALSVRNAAELYPQLTSHWSHPVPVRGSALSSADNWYGDTVLRDFTADMMFRDLVTYLPDDILTKMDRASMSVALEARVPILDHRVVEFAARMPLHLKLRGRESKWILRQVLSKYVPLSLIDRPKAGFAIPLGEWLRGPLREWASDMLAPAQLRAQGFFDEAVVSSAWADHLAGRADFEYHIWDVLMFQTWLEAQQQQQQVVTV